jgi:hypothetical protein
MNNLYTPYTLEEYTRYLITLGVDVSNKFECDRQYKLYLAIHDGDEKKIEIAQNSYFYNALFELQHRFN